ncbi:hypothetical protein NMY22_g9041 [Coprinellus aureogranulatus]|nr:hypothetical protein NMY22_g9041 [Coprinellus aureogranulatus]
MAFEADLTVYLPSRRVLGVSVRIYSIPPRKATYGGAIPSRNSLGVELGGQAHGLIMREARTSGNEYV